MGRGGSLSVRDEVAVRWYKCEGGNKVCSLHTTEESQHLEMIDQNSCTDTLFVLGCAPLVHKEDQETQQDRSCYAHNHVVNLLRWTLYFCVSVSIGGVTSE